MARFRIINNGVTCCLVVTRLRIRYGNNSRDLDNGVYILVLRIHDLLVISIRGASH